MSRLDKLKESYDAGREYGLTPPLPTRMHVEITNSCNLKCVMCYSPLMKRRKRFMKVDAFRRLAFQAAEHGIKEFGLYTTGEAFLHPRAVEFVRIAKREARLPYVYITSNGTLLDRKKADGIIEHGLDSLNLSIDGASKATYERIRVGGDFEELIENITYVRQQRDRAGVKMRICITCVVQKTNEEELGEFHGVFGAIADEIVFQPLSNMAGQMVDQFTSLLAPSMRDIYRRAARTSRENPCSLLWKQLNVSAEGFLTACCIDYELALKYADLTKVPLPEAWHNTQMQQMRRNMLAQQYQDMPMCGGCDQYRYDWTQLIGELQEAAPR
jgi:molybdenum cofactor biosynthesis enzyme MoaA